MSSIAKFEVSDTNKTGTKLVKISGQLDETNLPEMSAALDPMVTENGVENVILNFDNLEFLNSKVIGYLADFHSRLDAANRHMVISGASDSVTDILELVGLTTLVSCYPSDDAALQDLN